MIMYRWSLPSSNFFLACVQLQPPAPLKKIVERDVCESRSLITFPFPRNVGESLLSSIFFLLLSFRFFFIGSVVPLATNTVLTPPPLILTANCSKMHRFVETLLCLTLEALSSHQRMHMHEFITTAKENSKLNM